MQRSVSSRISFRYLFIFVVCRCAVFKLEGKEYAKLGVGQLYVKENEGKSSLLVRAATTTGK